MLVTRENFGVSLTISPSTPRGAPGTSSVQDPLWAWAPAGTPPQRPACTSLQRGFPPSLPLPGLLGAQGWSMCTFPGCRDPAVLIGWPCWGWPSHCSDAWQKVLNNSLTEDKTAYFAFARNKMAGWTITGDGWSLCLCTWISGNG